MDFGDLAHFAPNFGKSRAQVQAGEQTLIFSPNFPDAWRAGSGVPTGEGEAGDGWGLPDWGSLLDEPAVDLSQRDAFFRDLAK